VEKGKGPWHGIFVITFFFEELKKSKDKRKTREWLNLNS
jgi:hypothetical protein